MKTPKTGFEGENEVGSFSHLAGLREHEGSLERVLRRKKERTGLGVVAIRTRNQNGMLNIIGTRMREARWQRSWSANDLATRLQLLGVDLAPPGIYHIEKGKRSVSDFELLAIAQALEKDVRWLLGQTESREAEETSGTL